MPQKSNNWDPNERATSPSPERDEEDRETADSDEDFDEDDEFEESDEMDEDEEVDEE